MKYREVAKKLRQFGYEEIKRRRSGSHRIWELIGVVEDLKIGNSELITECDSQELPELITECDSLDEDEIKEVVTDAFYAIVELYDHQQRSLPEEIQILNDNTEDAAVRHLLETVVPIHEVSRSSQKAASVRL